MKLRGVLMLSDSFYPVRGGREMVIHRLMEGLNKKIDVLHYNYTFFKPKSPILPLFSIFHITPTISYTPKAKTKRIYDYNSKKTRMGARETPKKPRPSGYDYISVIPVTNKDSFPAVAVPVTL